MWAEPGFALTPAGAAYRWTGRPLPARYLVVAAVLHAAIFALWPRHPAPLAEGFPRLEILFRARPPMPAAAMEPPASPATAAQGGVRAPAAGHPPRNPAEGQTAATDPVPAVDGNTPLADAARTAARLEATRLARDPMAPSPTARETNSPLARATTRSTAGEKLLADGLVQITNPDGSRYCLLRPPSVANRDGPVPVLSIPMNCP